MKNAKQLRIDLIELSKERIGMSNYQSIMRCYQELLLGVIDILAEVEKKMAADEPPSNLT